MIAQALTTADPIWNIFSLSLLARKDVEIVTSSLTPAPQFCHRLRTDCKLSGACLAYHYSGEAVRGEALL